MTDLAESPRDIHVPPLPVPRDDQPIVHVELKGKHAGLKATCRTKFKAKRLADLSSGDVDRMLAALDGIILTHNFPDAEGEGELAETLSDVDMRVLGALCVGLTEELGKLPND